ncbi:UDP-glucosyltransferase 2, partial [Gonioctena quinquepunctata]
DVFMEMEKNPYRNLRVFMDKLTYLTNRILSQPRIQELAQSGKHFDLIIQDALWKDAELYFGYIFKAPVILTSALGTQNTMNYLVNNPEAPAYVPGCGLSLTDEMNFWERVQNVVFSWYVYVNLHFHSMQQEEILKTHFNDTPSIEELRENIALIFSNAHLSFQSPRPRSPNIIDIGGIHLGEPEPLPADLQKYMDSAREGVILFTMGSHIRTTVLPEETIKCIIKALSRIPQKVLLKWETDDISIASENILTRRWFPQTSVLAHPNLKAIVTHGGLNTKIEAIYFGVPMIGVPFFVDQKTNVAHSVAEGIAILINLRELSETTLYDALTEIVNNPRFNGTRRLIGLSFGGDQLFFTKDFMFAEYQP